MLTYNASFLVPGRSPQECFDVVADPDQGTRWAGSAKEIRAEGEPGVGRKIVATVDLIISFEITQTVSVWEPPNRYVFGADRPMKVTYDFRFEEEDGGTRVTCDLEADPGKFLPGGKLLLKGRFRKEFDGDMKRLEALLHSE